MDIEGHMTCLEFGVSPSPDGAPHCNIEAQTIEVDINISS